LGVGANSGRLAARMTKFTATATATEVSFPRLGT
jgi:hypothetical protein